MHAICSANATLLHNPLVVQLSILTTAVAKETEQRTAERQKIDRMIDVRKEKSRKMNAAKNNAAAAKKTEAAIFKAVCNIGPASSVTIARAVGMERTAVKRHLRNLCDEGRVVSTGHRLKPRWSKA